MGIFYVDLEIGDPSGQSFETVEALVDTGASYTVMPPSLLGKLGIVPDSRRAFVLADGARIERDLGETRVRMRGEERTSPVVFGSEGATPLLGALTLEIFSLGVDPVRKRLVPVDNLIGTQAPRGYESRLLP